MNSPCVVILAGPNGAGKTTASERLLVGALQVTEFVNADAIARGLSAFHPERVALEAGRIMLERLRVLADRRVSFAFETTLSSKTFAPWIAELRSTGYKFRLMYLWLPDVELSLARVQDRVRQGGHHVPEETIRRRYRGGLRNFFSLYQALADEWRFYDNSDPVSPRLIASGEGQLQVTVVDAAAWQRVQDEVDHER